MRQTGILAINARREAARAGNAFSIVAQEVGSVAAAIRNIERGKMLHNAEPMSAAIGW